MLIACCFFTKLIQNDEGDPVTKMTERSSKMNTILQAFIVVSILCFSIFCFIRHFKFKEKQCIGSDQHSNVLVLINTLKVFFFVFLSFYFFLGKLI